MVPLVLTMSGDLLGALIARRAWGPVTPSRLLTWAKSGQYCTDGRSGVNLDLDLLGVAQIPSNSGCR